MSQTNTKQCQDARRGGPSQGGSLSHCRGDRNNSHENSSFANSLFVGKREDSCISNLSITKSGPQSNQLKKILKALPNLCQDKHYEYSLILLVLSLSQHKNISYPIIQSKDDVHPSTT